MVHPENDNDRSNERPRESDSLLKCQRRTNKAAGESLFSTLFKRGGNTRQITTSSVVVVVYAPVPLPSRA